MKISSNAPTKLRSENLWKLGLAIKWTYEAADYYLPQKKTRAHTQQVLSVQTGLYR